MSKLQMLDIRLMDEKQANDLSGSSYPAVVAKRSESSCQASWW